MSHQHQVDVLISLSLQLQASETDQLVDAAKASLEKSFSAIGALRNSVVCHRPDNEHLVAIVRFQEPKHAAQLVASVPSSHVLDMNGLTIECFKFSQVCI